MKQISKLILLLLALLLPAIVHAHDFEVDGIYYLKNGNEASVTYRGTSYNQYSDEYTGEVIIPGTVAFNGTTYLVTSIGFDAFHNCTGLANVTIPNSVTSIESYAFSGCSSLASITIPNSVTSIGNSAFAGCSSLASITIPNSVTSIGSSAFRSCSSLASITIPNSVTSIEDFAFWGCSSLACITVASSNPKYDSRNNCNAIIETATNTIITGCKNTIIPNSVTIIGNSAFAGCTGLTCIDIPNSVTSIKSYAFARCSSLACITIPNSVTSIEYNAFFSCSSLVSITIPNSVTTIEGSAFLQCEGLTSVTFQHTDPVTINTLGEPFLHCPNIKNVYISDISFWCMNDLGVFGFNNSYVDNHIFLNGVELTNLTIPNNVTRIASCVFTGCNSVTSLVIPNSVTSISSDAFANCTGLKSISIPNSVTIIGKRAFYDCTGLKSISIPNSLTAIGESAFGNCTGLKSISIPSSVTEIGVMAFYDCIGLNDVFCYILDPDELIGTVDPWGWDSEYSNVSSRRMLHVPAGTIQNYQSDQWWNESYFNTIVEMDSHFEMPDTSVLYWETVTIPIVLSNDRNMLAFQTDIVLPEGFSIVTDEEDEYLIAPSNRLSSDHILMASDYGDGVVRVVCYTPESQPIDGYTGDLFYITVKVPENAAGDYPIILRNSRLTTEDYTELRIPDASSVIIVKTYIPGDANNSRSVTVTDIVVAAQYVLGRNPQPFIFGAADMNSDGDVSVTDIMLIAYMLQHPSVNAPLRAPALTANNDRMSADAISLMPGETRTVNIMLDNDLDYSAFQLDLTLPEGLTASNFALTDRANGHTFDVCTIDDGRLRALCYSPTLATINGHKGALLTFDVTAMTHVTGDIIVDAIELVTNTSQTVDMGAFNIQVNNSSAVNEIVSGKTVARVEYYNVAGQQIAEPTSGLTIIVTTYTDGTRSTNKLHR